jgi:hypothetical protein
MCGIYKDLAFVINEKILESHNDAIEISGKAILQIAPNIAAEFEDDGIKFTDYSIYTTSVDILDLFMYAVMNSKCTGVFYFKFANKAFNILKKLLEILEHQMSRFSDKFNENVFLQVHRVRESLGI